MKRITIIAALLVMGGTAHCDPIKDFRAEMEKNALRSSFAGVLADEVLCGLKYDREAVARWIAENIPAGDMGFIRSLKLQLWQASTDYQKMPPSAQVAVCEQTKRVAIEYGFIPR